MEIPSHLKKLYRHWSFHTVRPGNSLSPHEVFTDTQLFTEIQEFIRERMNIWKKKASGENVPYTQDPILSKYCFCNIFREFDRQTIEFHTFLQPLLGDFPLWLLNMFYCRMVARTETVKIVGLLSYNEKGNEVFYERFMQSPRPRFGVPYVFPISTLLKSKTPTRELFIAQHLPRVMQSIAKEIETWNKKSVDEGVKIILPIFGYNHSFLWTEVLIDVAYQFPQYIDLFGSFPVGPGSIPTMKGINAGKDPSELVQELSFLDVPTGITYENIPVLLSSENWEGIGCEFRKYTNLRNGQGRKRIFR